MNAIRSIWAAVGWFGIGLLLYLSLTPRPIEIPIESGDKYGHALAYALLTAWWAQLMTSYSVLMLRFVGLGVAIEFAQGWTGYRSFDVKDMLANTIGTAFGALIAFVLPNVVDTINTLWNRLQGKKQ
ncbi:VanZ family protein [Thraustotheca clavata]|uniref:VanZ family protein n=1 Tax=Thraustotheca clavata TaxID=74557 RepID=A0A1W0A334_9STRA|nr:VanZ family protein [Thraustotheca clavata]